MRRALWAVGGVAVAAGFSRYRSWHLGWGATMSSSFAEGADFETSGDAG
ncbi:MAG: hypothetical protein OEW30_05925 [Acidimicrobiia bacterium]|nr:hypothetical protein [Acidimicrobiia bacterium]